MLGHLTGVLLELVCLGGALRLESVCWYVDMPPPYATGFGRGDGAFLNSPFGHKVGILFGPLNMRCHIVQHDYVRDACVGNGCIDCGEVIGGHGHIVATSDVRGALVIDSLRGLYQGTFVSFIKLRPIEMMATPLTCWTFTIFLVAGWPINQQNKSS